MWLNKYVKIDRSSTKSQRKMVKECEKHIQQGSSVMIFPEGTRSRTGELKGFKEGAFLIAMQQKADIMPMVLDGSAKAWPEKEGIPRTKQKLYLRILPPVPYDTIKNMAARDVAAYVRQMIQKELQSMDNK